MTSSHILLIEDEPNLGETLQEYLTDKNFHCTWSNSAEKARECFKDSSYQVVLMDIGLPDGNGLDLAREFRSIRKDFVLLFLSAQNDPETRVEGLEIGAEDYITKPFALKELTLRLNRIIQSKESRETLPSEINLGPFKVWPKRFEIQTPEGKVVALNQKECAILEILYRNINEAVERDSIIDFAWGEEAYPSQRTVDNYIVKLRKIFEQDKNKSVKINSVRGVGYKLTQE